MKLKWELNKLKKLLPEFIRKKNKKQIYQKIENLLKTWEAIHSIVNVERKSKYIPCSLKHNGTLLFNSVKIAELSTGSLQILDLTLQKEFLKEKNHLRLILKIKF